MSVKKHGSTFLKGFVVAAPIIVTVYVVVAALLGLDRLMRHLLQPVWKGLLPRIHDEPIPGLGILVGLLCIYLIGLVAQSWLMNKVIALAESVLDRIPLVKSLYSAARDLLQFLGGAKGESRGKPVVIRSPDGKMLMLGLITQAQPLQMLPQDAERVAVYLPMSYQIGGYTVYVPREYVQEIAGMSVEELMKLTLTAGVGRPSEGSAVSPAPKGANAAPPSDGPNEPLF